MGNYANIKSAWNNASSVSRVVLVCMAYQLGPAGLSGFKKFLTHLANKDLPNSGVEMLDSKWAKTDSPKRAERMKNVLVNQCYGNGYVINGKSITATK